MKVSSCFLSILLGLILLWCRLIGCFTVLQLIPKSKLLPAINTLESKLLSSLQLARESDFYQFKTTIQHNLRNSFNSLNTLSLISKNSRNLRDDPLENIDNQREKKKNHRSLPFAFKGATVHNTDIHKTELNSVLKQRSELGSNFEKLHNLKKKFPAKHFSKYDSTGKDEATYSESQSGSSSSSFSSRSEEERIEEILMTQRNSNKLPIDNFVAGLHQIHNNDYAAEPVQAEKKEENLNDSFEEDEFVEEEEEEEENEYGGNSRNRKSTALQKDYYIRIQIPSNQMLGSHTDGHGSMNENENPSSVEKSFAFTLFSKYNSISTCYVYGDNGLALVSQRVDPPLRPDNLKDVISAPMPIPVIISIPKAVQHITPSYIQCETLSTKNEKILTPKTPLISYLNSQSNPPNRSALQMVIVVIGVVMVAVIAYYIFFSRLIHRRRRASTDLATPDELDVEQTCSLINTSTSTTTLHNTHNTDDSFTSLSHLGVQRRILSRPDLSTLSHSSGIRGSMNSMEGIGTMDSVGSLVNLKDEMVVSGKRRSRRMHGGHSLRNSHLSEGNDPMECNACGVSNPPTSVICRACGNVLV